jgi:hypothetical protein
MICTSDNRSPEALVSSYSCSLALALAHAWPPRLCKSCSRQVQRLVLVSLISNSNWAQRPSRAFDPRPDRGRPAHLWLEGPCHSALYKDVGAGGSKHEVRRETAPHRQTLIQSREKRS